jgi:hypothetical protein
MPIIDPVERNTVKPQQVSSVPLLIGVTRECLNVCSPNRGSCIRHAVFFVERGLHDGLNDGVAALLQHVVTHGAVLSLGCLCLPAIT